MLQLDPMMPVDSIEIPQIENVHELPGVTCLCPFLIVLSKCTGTDMWLKLSKLVLLKEAENAHCSNCTFSRRPASDYSTHFITGP